jgi:hypothetical protein
VSEALHQTCSRFTVNKQQQYLSAFTDMADSAGEPVPDRDVPASGSAPGTSSSSSGGGTGQQSSSSAGPAATSNLIQSVVAHYSNNITDALLMVTRICTIVFTFLFLLPFGGGTAFYK